MNDKTKAILEITAPNGQEFVDKGAIVNQTKGLNGVCIEPYIPTKATQKPVDTDSLEDKIEQAEADKDAYPLTWWTGYEYHSNPEGWNIFKKEPSHDIKFFNFRRLKNADIIMKCAQDRIDYPDFWHELTQWANLNELDNWKTVPFDAETFYEFNKYRPHPHGESIKKFNACSEADKKRWQCMEDGFESFGWYQVEGVPMWFENHKYRLRQRVCYITMQDGTKMEFPEPVREALEDGAIAFLVNPIMGEITEVVYRGCEYSKKYLRSGLLHATQENALQHLSAMQAMNAQVAL